MNLASLTLLLASTGTATAVWWTVPALSRPTLPFGVAVPEGRVADPAIAHARGRFSRTVIAAGVTVTALAFPLVLLVGEAVALTAATLVLVAVGLAAYLAAGRAVREAKRVGDWYGGAKQAVTADLSFRSDPVRVPWPALAPAVAIAVATVAVGFAVPLPETLPGLQGLGLDGGERVATGFWTAWNPVLAQAAVTLVTALCLAGVVRVRPEIDAARPAGTARRYRVYLRSVCLLGGFIAACVNLTLAGIALRLWEIAPASPVTTALVFAPIIAIAVAHIRFELKVGTGGHRLPAAPGEADEDTGLLQRDDDRHWHLGGFVYLNRDDPAVFVHQRAGGAQWTINLGSPGGRLAGLVVAAITVAASATAALDALGVLDLPSAAKF